MEQKVDIKTIKPSSVDIFRKIDCVTCMYIKPTPQHILFPRGAKLREINISRWCPAYDSWVPYLFN